MWKTEKILIFGELILTGSNGHPSRQPGWTQKQRSRTYAGIQKGT